MEPKFKFHEIVRTRITSPGDRAAALHGQEGRIAGMSRNADGNWGYAVFVYTRGTCWDFDEVELEATGKMDDEARAASEDRIHVRVFVDPVTGEGRLKNPEDWGNINPITGERRPPKEIGNT